MDKQLSSKQKLLLYIIQDFRKKNGRSPSLGELRKLLGVNYVTSVVHLLKKLEEKGYITKTSTERGIAVVNRNQITVNIPLLGNVACGRPLLAQENIEGYIPVDKKLINNSCKYFFLRAVGDSMDRAGINDGDLVLIQSQTNAKKGDKVVALIDDEATIKIFHPGNGYVALLPKSSNSANKPIILSYDFSIQGIVKEVYQKDMLQA